MNQVNNHPFRIISEEEIKEVTGGVAPGGCVPTGKFGEDGGTINPKPIYSTQALGEEGGNPSIYM